MQKHDQAQWLAAQRVVLRRELRFLGSNANLKSTGETGLHFLLELRGRRITPVNLEEAAIDIMQGVPLNHPISEEIL